jgi:hypothetical protein
MTTPDEVQDCIEFFHSAGLEGLEKYSPDDLERSDNEEEYSQEALERSDNEEEKSDSFPDKIFCPKFKRENCPSASPCTAKGKRGIRFEFEDNIYFVYRNEKGFYATSSMNYVPNSGVFLGKSRKEITRNLRDLVNGVLGIEGSLLQREAKA